MKRLRKMLPALLILTPLLFSPAAAEEFSASFKGTDIQEFINTVSKNLNKTVIIDPSVRVALAARVWVMASSATLVIEVSISGSIWPLSSSNRPARPGETADVFMGFSIASFSRPT